MASAGDEDADAVLSDVESDEPVPIVIKEPSQDEVSVEKFRQILAELDREKQAREAAENSKSELQNEDLAKQLEEVTMGKDGLRSEIETSAHMLVSGIEKISGKVSSFKNFAAGGLPRSQKYTGLPSVAYGVIKRTNEIVEELLKQIESTAKSRNEAREQIEQRNYEIAIEVSQLEATISGLREEVAKKSVVIEDLEKNIAEKDVKIEEIQREMSEKIHLVENESMELRNLASEYDEKLKGLESKMELQRPLLVDQLNLVSRIHERMYNVIKIVDADDMDQSDVSESFFLPQETDLEENIRACLAGMESIYELTRILVGKTKDLVEEKNREVKGLNETVSRLIKEKEHIGSLLRSALSKRMVSENNSKTNELFQTAENGLREAGIDFKFSKLIGDGNKSEAQDSEHDEIYNLAGALENIVKTSQLEIIELQHSVEELRAESSVLKEHVEAQAKELNQRLRRIEELEEKERVANESVEGLMMDIAAAEEEITRWKSAAEQEAAAGRAVEQEFLAQLSTVKQELEEAKQAMLESEKKLKFKEETAAAAMAARDAAEKSLRLADLRATRLRDRVEELSRQLEEFETREDSRGRNGARYVCWPWQWLGLDFVGIRRPEMQQHSSNEMELSEPLSEPLL
ncbi:hypothetical protein CCACVL1_24268 [Corchorus capsularis]|uniref:Uncharacterized protein n=1 Tax=Corchorus capsularis TaxID=210143 RepID=A0A1R3GQM2_COCAP|nr:hypothetical protein CCACVL1_24268 [Corchorus capsularis]